MKGGQKNIIQLMPEVLTQNKIRYVGMSKIVIRYQKFGSNWDVSIAASLIEFSLFGGVQNYVDKTR